MPTLPDGRAVTAARALLADHCVPQDDPWRSTVVRREEGGWVVRTWTHTPPHQSRPSGTPDYVHVVTDPTGQVHDFQIQQVHPAQP